MNTTNSSIYVECNYSNIETSFSALLDKPFWAVSDVSNGKIPYDPKDGKNASCDKPDTWTTFSKAKAYCEKNKGFFPSIVFPSQKLNLKNGLVCLDLDKINKDPSYNAFAHDLCSKAGSYCETSVSGQGLHIIMRGSVPNNIHNNKIELYGHGKFITLTGNILIGFSEIQEAQEFLTNLHTEHSKGMEKGEAYIGKPSPKFTDEEIISLCQKAKNSPKFLALYKQGLLQEYQDDHSSADLALCSILAFYTQNPEQLDRLFRKSKLYREKWEQTQYQNLTIEKALNGLKGTYQMKQKASWENPFRLPEGDDLDIEFPTEELPICLKDAVNEIARTYKVDPALVSLPGLGIAGLMIGKKAVIVEKPGLKHNASLFFVGVAASGERKSSCFDAILGGIKNAIDVEMEEYVKEKASIRTHNELLKEQVLDVKKDLKDKKLSKEAAQKLIEELYASEKPFPAEPYNFGDDITSPRLFQKLHDHGGVYGVFSSDARSIFKKIIGTKDGESGEAIYLGGMWGDDLSRSRVGNNRGDIGGEDMLIRKPALTTVAFIQPDLWVDLSKDGRMRESGLLSRINIVIPTSQMGTRFETPDDIPLEEGKITPFTEAILRLRKWKPQIPLEVFLSPLAAEARRNFYNAIEQQLGDDGRFADVKDIATKATSIASRICLIIAMLEAATNPDFKGEVSPISNNQWLKAQAFEEYFLAQAIDSQRTHLKSGSLHIKQKVALWLKKQVEKNKNTPVTVLISQIVKGVRGSKTVDIEKSIPDLLKNFWIRISEKGRGEVKKYEINPRLVNEIQ